MKLLPAPFLLSLLLLVAGAASADLPPSNLLVNPSFEAGAESPAGWTAFSLGGADWEREGSDGGRSVSITGLGDDTSWWSPKAPPELQPNRVYRLSYWLRKDADASGGTPIAGPEWVNRDSPASAEWSERAFCFRTPDVPMSRSAFRLGEWHVRGKVLFDAVTLTPAVPLVGYQSAGYELGEGESIAAGQYIASHLLGGYGSTDFRCLERFTARFNSDRWVFSGPADVVYRHTQAGSRQTEAEVELNVNYWVSGRVIVEVSADGKEWRRIGEMGKVGSAAFPVPSELLPAREVRVRLRGGEGADLQVNSYTYRCRLPDAPSDLVATGATHYLAVQRESPDLAVQVGSVGWLRPGGGDSLGLTVTSASRRTLAVSVRLTQNGRVESASETTEALPPGSRRGVVVPYDLRASGPHELTIKCADAASGESLWEGVVSFTVPPLYDATGGYLLEGRDDVAAWWCEPERKVSRERPLPTEIAAAVRIEAAAREYEAAQLVLTPRVPLHSVRITPTDLRAESGEVIRGGDIEVREVAYVHVSQPTDDLGAAGDWPDPLPLHAAPVELSAAVNHPFWVTVCVPPGTPKGVYRGALRVTSEAVSLDVPLEVKVFGFELPRETHLRSGFGLSQWEIKRYHNLETDEEVRQVYQLYQRSFAAHRVAPYSVGRPIKLEWEPGPGEGLFPKLDFAGFDEDAHFALDELGFNSFVIHLEGLGGGTFQSRRPGQIGPYQQGAREYELSFARGARAIQDHLEERGWLGKAYIYWFDEPAERDFDFVREGMELIHRAAPKLTRLLTTHPTAKLYGAVDLWCLPTYTLDPEEVRARQLAGEEIWWYLCTGPKAPYFTLFLDHYGTEIRLWSWETWKYGLDGLLVWETTYWTSEQAYPDSLQNPWQDAMSWQSSYGLTPGEKAPWGNGDGRFLYPPNRDPGSDKTKYLEGPVPSIRWELLRDGIEDYEYLWLLKQEMRRAGAAGDSYAPVLDVPAEICTSLTDFATAPEPIHAHRAKVAEAIERLRGSSLRYPLER